MAMSFGIFYEITVPRPWTPQGTQKKFKEVLAQVLQAEQSGFSHFWTVEHHFLDEFSQCSAPEVLYGAVSQITKKIKIGHAVRLLPFPYNHPVRVAEMAATLDLLCDGRLEFGTGRSASINELGGFGVQPREARPMWEEALDVVVAAWTQETFSWEGKYFKIPPRTLVPKPLQQPHPPIWAAASGFDSHVVAGRKGLGLLSLTLLVPLEEVHRRIEAYRDAIKNPEPAGKFVNNRTAVFTVVHCAETDAQARKNAEESINWHIEQSFQTNQNFVRAVQAGLDPTSYEYMMAFMNDDPKKRQYDYLTDRGLVIAGSAETCIRKLKAYESMGIEHLLCIQQLYKMPHEAVMNSIRLLGDHVIPAFAN